MKDSTMVKKIRTKNLKTEAIPSSDIHIVGYDTLTSDEKLKLDDDLDKASRELGMDKEWVFNEFIKSVAEDLGFEMDGGDCPNCSEHLIIDNIVSDEPKKLKSGIVQWAHDTWLCPTCGYRRDRINHQYDDKYVLFDFSALHEGKCNQSIEILGPEGYCKKYNINCFRLIAKNTKYQCIVTL